MVERKDIRLPSAAQIYWHILKRLDISPQQHLEIINNFLEALNKGISFQKILIKHGKVQLISQKMQLVIEHPWQNLYLFYPILLGYQHLEHGQLTQNALIVNSELPDLAWIFNSIVIDSTIAASKAVLSHAIIINSVIMCDGVLELQQGYLIGTEMRMPSIINRGIAPSEDIILDYWLNLKVGDHSKTKNAH